MQVVPPIGKDPLLGLPTPVPLPRLERLYFKCVLLWGSSILNPPGPCHEHSLLCRSAGGMHLL